VLAARIQAALQPLVDAPTCLLIDDLHGGGDVEVAQATQSDHLACLQYTSGSTANPKGVMLSHANLLHNAALIQHVFEHDDADKYVSWLPLFHDMGLMVGVVEPVFAGLPVILMSPVSFLQRPARWLAAISRYRATISGAPDFAYDLCARRIAPSDVRDCDLRCWAVAFNGAEPVRAATLERFSRAFAPHGFRRRAFYPCYGLAEATLAVSGGLKTAEPVLETFDLDRLLRGEVVRTRPGAAGSRTLVGCGRSMPGQRIRIVDAESGVECAPDRVGEVWVAGPSVAQGYWANAEATCRTFRASVMPRQDGPWLRTGDLGFLSESGELFITGRLSDVLIVNGRNHHPQDIELTVERSHPSLLTRGGAAFAVTARDLERVVVVHEVDVSVRLDARAVIGAIRQAVAEEHELPVSEVVLVPPGAIPRTSSGKIQRRSCRERFLAGTLDRVATRAELR
jgi:acyl-CoA synthetase (AMP-forming)/AMP-acid ligase II